MKGMILKDFLNLKGYMKTLVAMMAAICFIGFATDDLSSISAYPIFFGAFLLVSTCSYDEMAKWDAYALCQPVGRKQIVLSKYIVSLLLSFAGAIAGVIITYLFSFILKDAQFDLELTLTSCFIMALVANIMLAFLLPIIFKIGTEKARYVLLLLLMVPMLIFYSGVLSSISIPTGVLSFISEYFIWVCVACFILVEVISYMISLAFYTKREF